MPADADEPLAVWAAFLRAHSTLTAKLERELIAERALPLAWYEVLLQIKRAGRPLRMQELAGSVLLSKSGLTRLVDRMEAAGLVERTNCPSDQGRPGRLQGRGARAPARHRRALHRPSRRG